MKKLEKTCNLSVFFDIFRYKLYPPFDFQMIYARVCNRWKATRESLEPPPTTTESQPERDGCSGTRKGKAILFYRREHACKDISFFVGCYIGGEGTPQQWALDFTPRITIFFRWKNVQSVTSLKNAKPEKTRMLKKLIMQALDLYSHFS